MNPEPTLRRIRVDVCDLCLSGAGGECHVPGCAFWMQDAPVGAFLLWMQEARRFTALCADDEIPWCTQGEQP